MPYFFLLLLVLTGMIGCVSMRKRPVKLFNAVRSHARQFDAIIVPGVPFVNGKWDSTMKARVLWSYYLYQQGIAKNVIYSGGAVYSPYVESKIMGLYAQQLGIPKEHIFCDTLAEHSTENVYFSYLLARDLGFKSIALATDPFQSGMLRSFTRRRFRTEIVHIPFVIDTLKLLYYQEPVINPTSAYQEHFVPITQREGVWKRFRGTLGKHIEWVYKHPNNAGAL